MERKERRYETGGDRIEWREWVSAVYVLRSHVWKKQ